MDKLSELFFSIIQQHVNSATLDWLQEKADLAKTNDDFRKYTVAFSMVARKIKNSPVVVERTAVDEIEFLRPRLSISDWSIRRLVRVWLIMQLNAEDKKLYTQQVRSLFSDADMNELATLYAALPVLAYPEYWEEQCAEGVRSNIGTVLEAVIINNPYPAEHLKEEAWNQLVLKAFFTEKDISKIIGLDERNNAKLVKALQDYADERRSAKREVNPKLWDIVNKNNNK